MITHIVKMLGWMFALLCMMALNIFFAVKTTIVWVRVLDIVSVGLLAAAFYINARGIYRIAKLADRMMESLQDAVFAHVLHEISKSAKSLEDLANKN